MATTHSIDSFRKWRRERERDLDRWEADSSTPDAIESALNKITNAGNAERALAGSHEGREILELLQNARDAIRDGDPETGRVYVGVFETGVLVANTGEPFDLLDDEIMNTVRKVGESKKSGDSIGHKGVGLNSVLAVGDAFEVWSRLPALDDLLRVRYSRAYLTAALARRFGHDVPVDDLCSDLHPEALVETEDGTRRLTAHEGRIERVSLPDDVGKLPLFWYPWPLRPETDDSPVASRAYDLLTAPKDCLETFETSPDKPFRTAVFIEYEDERWRALLDRLDTAPPDEEEETIDASEQAELLWRYLSNAVDRSTSLRPETVVQLGEIDELYIERVDTNGATTDAEHWSVDRDERSVPGDALQYERVETTIHHAVRETHLTRSFDRFWRTDCPETDPSLLVSRSDRQGPEVDDTDDTRNRIYPEYPLYLFYPINRTERHSLPFCLHGRFRVSTDRQDLSQSAKQHNLGVLADGAELIEMVAKSTAVLSTEQPDRWAVYPWVLLPPNTDRAPSDPASTVELMEWLCTEIYRRLSDVACFPNQRSECHRPQEATVHPDRDITSGFVAGLKLGSSSQGAAASRASPPPLPHLQELDRTLDARPVWRQRLKRLVIADGDREAFTKRILDDWTAYLGEELTGEDDDSTAISVQKADAHDLFEGTTALIRERAEQVDGSEEVLSNYADAFDDVYLLPCEKADSVTESWLVQVEYRAIPGTGRSARTVVWGRAEELQSDEFPPKHGNFDVYFLDETIQEPAQGILSNAGDYWGLRQSDGFAELYRSLLGTFGAGRRLTIDSGSLGALATLVTRVDESQVSSLRTGEASFLPSQYMRNAPEPSKRERRGQINIRLGLRQATLDVLGTDVPLADFTLPTAWQRERTLARNEDENASESADPDVVKEWVGDADLPGPSLPPPSGAAWKDVPVTEAVPSKPQRLARLLSLLGASALPGIRVLWMYSPEHPEIRGSAQPHWNPLEWDDTSEQHIALRDVLKGQETYLTWLTSISNHPSQSASHVSSCDEQPVLEKDGSGSNLVAWVWFDPDHIERLTTNPKALITTLGRHGKQYATTVLTTHWFCKSYKNCDPSGNLPTLANWQLRHLPIWSSVLNVGASVKERWGDDGDRLAWAVLEGGMTGAQGWRLFPSIDPEDTPLSRKVLETLGVPSLDDLSVSEAEYRLQKLQSVLADELSETRVSSIDIPTSRQQDWGRAYSQLLQPIMQYVSREELSDIEELRNRFSYLTHVPLRRIHEESDEWVAAPLSWLADHASDVRRYPEESPTPWEQKRVRDNEWYLLDFPQVQAGFADFATALGVKTVEAQKPVPSVEDDDFDLVEPHRERLDLDRDRRELRRRRTLLLASIGVTGDERIVEESEKLETAVDNLAVTESFPPWVAEQLSDPRSGLYEAANGDIGLVYNRGEADALERDALAMGLALLFEQYRNVAVFETALDPGQSRTELRERWRKETFPIQTVETAIEDHTRRSVRKKLAAGRDLLHRTDSNDREVPTAEALIEEFDDEDVTAEETRILTLIGQVVHSDTTLNEAVPAQLADYVRACRESEAWVRTMLTKLFGAGETATARRELVENRVPDEVHRDVIQWLVEHEPLFDTPIAPDEFMPTVERFLGVYRAWSRTSEPVKQLDSLTGWKAVVRDQYRAADPELADQLPAQLCEIAATPSDTRWFAFSDPDELAERIIEPFWQHLEAEGAVEAPVREMLASFVSTEEFGIETDEATRSDHKGRAYAAAEDAILSGRIDDFDPVRSEELLGGMNGAVGDASVRTSSGQGGGGSTQLRGRGEQAEVAVTLDILQSLRAWLQSDERRYDQVVETIRGLSTDQEGAAYQWHTKTEWKDTLHPLLNHPPETIRRQFTDYENLLGEGIQLDDLAPVKLLDVSGENGPGFDVIDPFGTLRERKSDEDASEWELNPAPIEIKAVSGASPPFEFRFTMNEFRQAKRFTHPF
ncbi:MAG: sacsin N-terminal ATP-binding-like domain-containing protein [Halorhabdus sp.]